MKKKQFQFDMVFEFISSKTKMNENLSLSIVEIRDAMGLKKSSCNNNLQYLYKNNAIARNKVDGESRYYSVITDIEYKEFCKQYRKRGANINNVASKKINEFIYSGCPERIQKHLFAEFRVTS